MGGARLVNAYRVLGSGALHHLRRGSRTVLWAPSEGLGFGNMLYLWLHAHIRQRDGADYLVLSPPPMRAWLTALPALRSDLTLERDEVRFSDRREFVWANTFGADFDRHDLDAFIDQYLLGTSLVPAARPDPHTVTVNIRRGNYYAAPHFRGTYGFDIPAYLEIALNRARDAGPISRLAVVSDDIDWCRLKLDGLLRQYGAVTYVPPSDTPQDNFRTVACAQRLIGTNSTFSYWAGYVSNALYGPDSHVVMPWFHARLGDDYGAYQLDHGWDVVREIPGGWDV